MVRFETQRRDAGGQAAAAARLGGAGPLPLFGRADADRGPVREPARLPGAALPPRRRERCRPEPVAPQPQAPGQAVIIRPGVPQQAAPAPQPAPPPRQPSRSRSCEAGRARSRWRCLPRRSRRRCSRARWAATRACRSSIYDADQVVQLQATPGYQLTVEFSPDEQIESVARRRRHRLAGRRPTGAATICSSSRCRRAARPT